MGSQRLSSSVPSLKIGEDGDLDFKGTLKC